MSMTKVETIPELVSALREWLADNRLDVWVRVWAHVSFDSCKAGATLEITAYVNPRMCPAGKTTTSEVRAVGATPQIVFDKCTEMLTADLRPRSQVFENDKQLTSMF